jgi:hypothetical protein
MMELPHQKHFAAEGLRIPNSTQLAHALPLPGFLFLPPMD